MQVGLVRDLIVHEFKVGDSEDPNVIAQFSAREWLENTPAGQWLIKNNKEMIIEGYEDYEYYGFKYYLKTKLSEEEYLIFLLSTEGKDD